MSNMFITSSHSISSKYNTERSDMSAKESFLSRVLQT